MEILVAMSIFLTVVTIASAYFVSAVVAQRQVLVVRPMADEVSFLAEYISRALRPAQKSAGTCDVPAESYYELTHGGAGVKFIDRDGRCREIFAEDGFLRETIDGATANLTSSSISVAAAAFEVLDAESGTIRHPRVTVSLAFEATSGASVYTLQWQTTISQRDFRNL